MINCDDIETVCILRFGNKNPINMQATLVFLNLHRDVIWKSSGNIAKAIIEAIK